MPAHQLRQKNTSSRRFVFGGWLLLFIFGILLALTAAWWWSRGLYYYRHERFDPSPHASASISSQVRLRLVPTYHSRDADLGISWGIETAPYFLVYSGDFPKGSDYKEFRVTNVELVFPNATPIVMNLTTGRVATVDEISSMVGKADGLEKEYFCRFEGKIGDTLPDAVADSDSLLVRLSGHLVGRAGDTEPVTVEQVFKRTRSTGVVPYRWVLQQL